MGLFLLCLITFLRVAGCTTLTFPSVIGSGVSHASSWEVTLSVEEFRFRNSQLEFNTRAFCHGGVCSVPGPTIVVVPGDKFTLHLVNNLGKNDDEEDNEKDSFCANALCHANTTNMHTHGLHIDPTVDDVSIPVQPGASWTYKYEVPANHAPGTHWYHSHYHGSSSLQVMGGLVGALIVAPSGSENLPASISAADAFPMVVTR